MGRKVSRWVRGHRRSTATRGRMCLELKSTKCLTRMKKAWWSLDLRLPCLTTWSNCNSSNYTLKKRRNKTIKLTKKKMTTQTSCCWIRVVTTRRSSRPANRTKLMYMFLQSWYWRRLSVCLTLRHRVLARSRAKSCNTWWSTRVVWSLEREHTVSKMNWITASPPEIKSINSLIMKTH